MKEVKNMIKCERCNKNNDILELSYNKEIGWLCKDCATETNTALNLFLDKKQETEQQDPGPMGKMGRDIHDPDSDKYQPFQP